ncbi:hypothetical protein C1H46_007938 [Malus baccata]|uniref:Uncharacterized protein n=1 Tax=Malus baccata TaxID=106549 RepID=A0A540N5Z9_MALBA|nr:hypothetical protein C1H46_007938 [Malus baccata]
MEKERVVMRTSANRIDIMWGGKNKQKGKDSIGKTVAEGKEDNSKTQNEKTATDPSHRAVSEISEILCEIHKSGHPYKTS